MSDEISRPFKGASGTTPYVPSWCFDAPGPKTCVCFCHEGYHNDAGECLRLTQCGCGVFQEMVSEALKPQQSE